MTYFNGAAIRCSAVFTNLTGTAIDPSTVTFMFKNPGGTTTTYNYPTDPQLVKDSVGHYHVDVTGDTDGVWSYRYDSTGTGQAAGEASFTVTSVFI